MSSTFNGQILVEKLAKLNNTQQSIETLSHWCIFHMKKAKQVVETWDRQFHCSPREQRLCYLYLANDILQNSRRKGSEFVDEFWKVLPNALSDVTKNGDEFGRNAALRLVGIWEERKVFGSCGQMLKEDITGRNLEKRSSNGTNLSIKQGILEKIVSGYGAVCDGSKDEEALFGKCRESIRSVDKLEKDIGGNYISGQLNGSEFLEPLKGQQNILRECIVQLRAAESSRQTLVSHLKEALQEQENQLEQVRTQLQAAQSRSDQASNICQNLMNRTSGQLLPEQKLKEANTLSDLTSTFATDSLPTNGNKEPSGPVMYTRQLSTLPEKASHVEEDPRKSAAAAVVAKLTASPSSAEMLTFVLSSLASGGVSSNHVNKSSEDYPSEKRLKLEKPPDSQYPQPAADQQPQPPPYQHPGPQTAPFAYPSSLNGQHQSGPASSSPMSQPTPPPSANFVQTAGSMTSVPYICGSAPQQPKPQTPLPSYQISSNQPSGMPSYSSPSNPYQNFQGPGNSFHNHAQPLPATPPISRQ